MRLCLFIFSILGLLAAGTAFPQGLKFCGSEYPIAERTSYDVFDSDPPVFTGRFGVAFDMALYPETEIGYIIRIKNEKSHKIYNLFYDGQGGNLLFRLNEEGRSSLITAEIERSELPDAYWFRMKIDFDLTGDSVSLTIHDRTFRAGNVGLPDRYYPVLLFGKSDYIIDVPSFAIRNLCVGDDPKYMFPLRESEGNVVYNARGRAAGRVVNPQWLINDAYHWRFRAAFASQTVAGANYNPERKEIYYFNRDSIFVYDVKSGETAAHAFCGRCPVELTLGTNFVDAKRGRLYAYEVYSENSPPLPAPTVAGLDLTDYSWCPECTELLPTQLHHHGAYYDPELEQYTIFGGFGNMHYSKNFHTFDLHDRTWRTLGGFTGDTLCPRYFSSVGYLKDNNSVYVFGGMGNESGEQVVGRYYFYDLHRVDLTTKRITKLWEIPWDKANVVPVRGMVIPDDKCFYTLCYPESRSDSFLRLYRFSIADGSYEILGDSIPIHSDKITTNANLYYDEQLNDLFATVQEFDDDIVSDMKVYALAFPPITAEDLADWPGTRARNLKYALVLLGCLLAFGAGFVALRRLRRGYGDDRDGILYPDAAQDRDSTARPDSISLFGDFTVRDRHNRDITYLFSVRLRQTFCLILQHSAEEGISSQRLSSLLWPDKPEDKVKNSRGVTINHLRKILGEMDGIELIHSKGCFKLVQSEPFYCDYTRCCEIISSGEAGGSRDELIRILGRGKFLKGSDQPLFDSFKEQMERMLEPVLQLEMEKSFAAEEYPATLRLAGIVFDIDPLNDEALAFQVKALHKLKQHDQARISYQTFAAEYKKTFGCDYPQPFKNF